MNKLKKFFEAHDLVEIVLIYLPVNIMALIFVYFILRHFMC
jgi:type III secretory pathway component EscU